MRKVLLISAALIFLTSCLEKEDYPIVPNIEFVSFTKIPALNGIDDKGIMTISFTDGDGNIGLTQADTLAPFDTSSMYYYNFFIKYLERQNGELIEVSLPFTNNSRIPLLSDDGIEQPLKGEIEIELFINNPLSNYDTIAFEVFITDRTLNHSNTIITTDIIVNK